jgi:hypothetical protein
VTTTTGLLARDNPFAAHRVERIPYRFAAGTWHAHIERLAGLNFRAAIVGPHGSGKTTLLEQLADRLRTWPAAPPVIRHLFLARATDQAAAELGELRLSDLRDTCVLLDGFERLGVMQRRVLGQLRSGGLVVTAHRRCRLPTWVHTTTSRETLDYLLEQLGIVPSTTMRRMGDEAYRSTGGNLRDALRRLYDRAGELTGEDDKTGASSPRSQGLCPSGRISSLAFCPASSAGVPANHAGIGSLPGG